MIRGIPSFERDYSNARYEHAWLLRAEGLKLKEIGSRLGVNKDRARNMIAAFGREVQRRLSRTRFTIVRSGLISAE